MFRKECDRCHRVMGYNKPLCSTCKRSGFSKERPDQRKPGDKKCLGCGFMAQQLRLFLCGRCYKIKRLAGQLPKYKRMQKEADELEDAKSDLTEEELDKMIAEQMKCLPSWWEKESMKLYEYQRHGKLSKCPH